MATTFSCPHCRAVLNPQHAIILKATHEGQQVLVGMHPEPGNYQVFVGPGVTIPAGSTWDFFCPVCQADLAVKEQAGGKLCALQMTNDSEDHQVFFSRIAGEQATYVVNASGAATAHGSAAAAYSDVYVKYVRG